MHRALFKDDSISAVLFEAGSLSTTGDFVLYMFTSSTMARRLLSNFMAAARLPISGYVSSVSPARASFTSTHNPVLPVVSQRSFENLRDWLMSVNAHLGDAVAVPFQKARFHQNLLPYVAGKRNGMLVWDGDIIVECVRRARNVMFAWGRSNVRVLCVAPPQFESIAEEFQSLIMPDWPEVKKLVAAKPLRELFRERELHAVVFIRPDLTQRLTRECLAAQVSHAFFCVILKKFLFCMVFLLLFLPVRYRQSLSWMASASTRRCSHTESPETATAMNLCAVSYI
jgi:hypothetical protein